MIELPEAIKIAEQINEYVSGKTVSKVLPPSKPHKFCWFNGEPNEYDEKIKGARVVSSSGFGIFAEIGFDNGQKLSINDGVNVRLVSQDSVDKSYQLIILFEDDTALVFTVAMYGGIVLHDGTYDNEYYLKSLAAISPFSEEFEKYYLRILGESKPTLSLKAFLATEQRFPGIGNGVLQDILFRAKLNPRQKIGNISDDDREKLLQCIRFVLLEMKKCGGRDTEKNLFGEPGGSVYYCPCCQAVK